MKKTILLPVLFFSMLLIFSFSKNREKNSYTSLYFDRLSSFKDQQKDLLQLIEKTGNFSEENINLIVKKINVNRCALKATDFWLRYFEPTAYKKLNGPISIEWETEVFEKYEPPYKREGAGLTLATLYLNSENPNKDSLINFVKKSLPAFDVFNADSITSNLKNYHHFFLANRMFLLNLASIYTTGFECPDTSNVIPELLQLLKSTTAIYNSFEESFPAYKISNSYNTLFAETISFVEQQPKSFSSFDHFKFIKDFINPLYKLNQEMILQYQVRSSNFNDYSLNKYTNSIFDKSLYSGQNSKGVFIGIDDQKQLNELKAIGKQLFYDPILSHNNKRSCASCHKPTQFYTDTVLTTGFQYDQKTHLPRNTPTLINAVLNHLLMLDGKHINLGNQAREVITNPIEMGSDEDGVLKKIMSCDEYKIVFKKYLSATPQYKSVNLEHVTSALMLFYSDLSFYSAPFDEAMNKKQTLNTDAIKGFNLFMSKAQCGTCHFVPQFNGTKPPFISSEFEVIGIPVDTSFKKLDTDKGRYSIFPEKEMDAAFRTSTIRNAALTKPYMHNGIFKTLEEIIEFYDAGGGIGKGLIITNQTVSSDSLKLTKQEKQHIIAFIHALTETIPEQIPPYSLPVSKNKELNIRKIGGEY